ncbi:MAG: hypothetical protein RL757_3243 [Bacteroidota bacterium]
MFGKFFDRKKPFRLSFRGLTNSNVNVSIVENPQPTSLFWDKRLDDLTDADVMELRAMPQVNYMPHFYYKRPVIDHFVEEKLQTGAHLVVIGNPLGGKTRAIWEGLQVLRKSFPNTYHVFRPNFTALDDRIELPPFPQNKKIILFLDDIHRFFDKSPEGVNALMAKFILAGAQVVATCRTGYELKNVTRKLQTEVNTHFQLAQIEIKLQEKQLVDQIIALQPTLAKNKNDYDRNIGSLFIGLTMMRDRYQKQIIEPMEQGNRLATVMHHILYALKCHYYSFNTISTGKYDQNKIKTFTQLLLPDLTEKEWKDALRQLDTQPHQLNFLNAAPPSISIEDVYLEQIVDPCYPDNPRRLRDEIYFQIERFYPTAKERKNQGFYTKLHEFNQKIQSAANYQAALAFFQEMPAKGIKPNFVTYSILIHKSDTFLEALSLQEEMIGKGIEPNLGMYHFLIRKSDTFFKALSLQKEMVGKGIEPSLRMYHLLISKSDTFLEALSLQEEMLAKGIKPTLGTSYSLIGKFQLCEGDEKWALLKCIIDDFSDNLFMYKIFITITGQWIKQKKLDVGLFLERYHQFVIQNDRTIYTFCSYLESAGHVEATLKLLEHVKEKNSEYFNVRANCQKHTDLAAALTLYDEAIALANQPKVIAKYWNNKALAIYQARRNDLLADAKAFAMRSQTLHAHGYGFNTLKQLESWESELSK